MVSFDSLHVIFYIESKVFIRYFISNQTYARLIFFKHPRTYYWPTHSSPLLHSYVTACHLICRQIRHFWSADRKWTMYWAKYPTITLLWYCINCYCCYDFYYYYCYFLAIIFIICLHKLTDTRLWNRVGNIAGSCVGHSFSTRFCQNIS